MCTGVCRGVQGCAAIGVCVCVCVVPVYGKCPYVYGMHQNPITKKTQEYSNKYHLSHSRDCLRKPKLRRGNSKSILARKVDPNVS